MAEEDICRFCFGGLEDGELVQPCNCRGSVRFVHVHCLKEWQKQKLSNICDLCRSPYADNYKVPWTQRLKRVRPSDALHFFAILFYLLRVVIDVTLMVALPKRLARLSTLAFEEYKDIHNVVTLINLEICILSVILFLRVIDFCRILIAAYRFVN